MLKRIVPVVLILSILLLCGCTQKATRSDGAYDINVTLEGGTGRASISSPTVLFIEDGAMTARIEWSSNNYDYMIVEGERYDAEIEDEHSVFIIPVKALDEKLTVIADTTAMSVPHEIEYTLYFDSSTMKYIH